MGCSNVACNLTSHSMCDDEAIFLGLIPSLYKDKNVSRIFYCTGAYSPLLLPIYGKLNTYGRLEDIVDTKYVQFLKSKNLDPYDLIDFKLEENSIVSDLNGTFISREALDYSNKYIYNSNGTNIQIRRWTPYLLKLAGIDIKDLARIYPYGDYIITSEYSFNSYSGNIFKDKEPLSFKDSCSELKALGYDINGLLSNIGYKSNLMLEIEEHFLDLSPSMSEDPEYIDLRNKLNLHTSHDFFRVCFGNLYLTDKYRDFISEYFINWKDFITELTDLCTLSVAMNYSNKFWHPQQNDFQSGNIFQEFNLTRLQVKLAGVDTYFKKNSVDSSSVDFWEHFNKKEWGF